MYWGALRGIGVLSGTWALRGIGVLLETLAFQGGTLGENEAQPEGGGQVQIRKEAS